MPDKHENTERWGGPGASHEDRTERQPKDAQPRPRGDPTNTPYSGVSGGGERDRHHAHDAAGKRDTEQNSEERRKHDGDHPRPN